MNKTALIAAMVIVTTPVLAAPPASLQPVLGRVTSLVALPGLSQPAGASATAPLQSILGSRSTPLAGGTSLVPARNGNAVSANALPSLLAGQDLGALPGLGNASAAQATSGGALTIAASLLKSSTVGSLASPYVGALPANTGNGLIGISNTVKAASTASSSPLSNPAIQAVLPLLE